MLKAVGYIGYGFVGKACERAFRYNSEAIILDPKYSETTWDEFALYQPRLTFVSLPAPTLEDGSVDASLIYTVFKQLNDIKYTGIVVLKSTLPPAVVEDLYDLYGSEPALNKVGTLRYIYSPEFLREGSWEQDALAPSQVVMAGNWLDVTELTEIYKNHSHIRYTRFVHTDYHTAAMAKYTINCFLAIKVTFMNQIYQLYSDVTGEKPHSEMWDAFAEILCNDPRFGHSHLKVPGPDGKFGYGGTCFPKDMKAFTGFDENQHLSIVRDAIVANTKLRLTGNTDSE